MNRAYRIALTCGFVPLVAGLLTFVFWLVTRHPQLMAVGLFVIAGGLILFLAGAVALIRYWSLGKRDPELPRRQLHKSTLMAAGLLLLNFPVAGGLSLAAAFIETSYVVIVHNDSPQPLEDVRVTGGGTDVSFGTLEPGRIARRTFWVDHDGELRFGATLGATDFDETLDDYVTNNLGGHITVTIDEDGNFALVDEGHW